MGWVILLFCARDMVQKLIWMQFANMEFAANTERALLLSSSPGILLRLSWFLLRVKSERSERSEKSENAKFLGCAYQSCESVGDVNFTQDLHPLFAVTCKGKSWQSRSLISQRRDRWFHSFRTKIFQLETTLMYFFDARKKEKDFESTLKQLKWKALGAKGTAGSKAATGNSG